MGMFTPKQLYAAIRSAETDMLDTKQWGNNRWRRTSANTTPNGSTAYGPVQITMTRVSDYLNPKVTKKKFSDKEIKGYADKFKIQSDLYNIHGNEKKMKGYDSRLGYSNKSDPTSGVGMLTSKEDKENYIKMAEKMIADTYSDTGGDIDKFIKSWRSETEAKDPSYYKKVKAYLKANP